MKKSSERLIANKFICAFNILISVGSSSIIASQDGNEFGNSRPQTFYKILDLKKFPKN